jgi:hypothetical protein
MRPPLGIVFSSLLALASCLAGRPARAENACVDAYEQAQELRLGKHLARARDKLRICADRACPAATKKDCGAWLKEVEQSLPTLVVVARDPDGADLAGAWVLFDGAPAPPPEGGAMPIDPGKHQVRCELEGRAPQALEVTIQEGEKARLLACVLPPETPPVRSRVPVGAVVAGGLGVVALGLWAGYGIRGIEDRAHLSHTCYPRCMPAAVDSVRNELHVADGALGVGIAALGVATVLFFVHRSRPAPPPPAITAALFPGGARLGFVGSF